MKKTTALKVLNPILGILLINQIMTGILHETLTPETFKILHPTGGLILAIVAFLHVILNWNWIKANFLKKGSVN